MRRAQRCDNCGRKFLDGAAISMYLIKDGLPMLSYLTVRPDKEHDFKPEYRKIRLCRECTEEVLNGLSRGRQDFFS